MLKQIAKLPLPLQIALAGAAGFALYKLFKKPPPETVTQAKVEDEIKKSESDGVVPTYGNSQYNIFADSLAAAMFDVGTNTDTLYSVIGRMKKNIDVLKLIAAFGIRPYYWFGWKQGDYNLSQWFAEELNAGNYERVNAILQANNVQYRF